MFAIRTWEYLDDLTGAKMVKVSIQWWGKSQYLFPWVLETRHQIFATKNFHCQKKILSVFLVFFPRQKKTFIFFGEIGTTLKTFFPPPFYPFAYNLKTFGFEVTSSSALLQGPKKQIANACEKEKGDIISLLTIISWWIANSLKNGEECKYICVLLFITLNAA